LRLKKKESLEINVKNYEDLPTGEHLGLKGPKDVHYTIWQGLHSMYPAIPDILPER